MPEASLKTRSKNNSLLAGVRHVADRFYTLLQSEIQLAKAEARQNIRDIARQSAKVATFAVIAMFGLLSLLSSAILLLGSLLEQRFWLSSLIIGFVLLIPSAILAIRSMEKIGKKMNNEMKLPAARQSIQDDREMIAKKFNERIDQTKRQRAA